jgi:hypothetical protein
MWVFIKNRFLGEGSGFRLKRGIGVPEFISELIHLGTLICIQVDN